MKATCPKCGASWDPTRLVFANSWDQFLCGVLIHKTNGNQTETSTCLTRQRDQLAECLGLFVALLQDHHEHLRDDHPMYAANDVAITYGDLRRARSLLSRINLNQTKK